MNVLVTEWVKYVERGSSSESVVHARLQLAVNEGDGTEKRIYYI